MFEFSSMDRVKSYLSNMEKYDNDMIITRFLDKVYRFVMEASSKEECMSLMSCLVNFMKRDKKQNRKCLCSLYLYKMSKAIGSDAADFPVIKSPELIRINVEYRPMPEAVRKMVEENERKVPLAFAESSKPDEEALEKFHVYISKDHFYGKR